MNVSLSETAALILWRDLGELLGQLQAADPADFGGIARRTSEVGERLVEWLWQERGDLLKPSASTLVGTTGSGTSPEVAMVTRLVDGWICWAYERNQFFDIDVRAKAVLEKAHRALLIDVRLGLANADNIEGFANRSQLALVRYAERLARVFRRLEPVEGLRGRGAEYSAELQLEVLGLSTHEWQEPIVDLGCGVDSRLVRFLRGKGLNATGIERRAGAPFAVAADWFDLRFDAESLGTLVSHLAFSLQFLHHHWHLGDRAYDYARKYMELLHSLKPGGLLCYAPGLPFIECLLDPGRFAVTTRALPEPLASTIESLRDLGTGQSVAYVSQIRRL